MPIKHIAFIDFQEKISQERIEECFKKLGQLVGKIPGLISFTSGKYNSSEGLNKNFSYGFEMVFVDERARDNYLINPLHQEVASDVIKSMKFPDGVVIFDFRAKTPTPPPSPELIYAGAKHAVDTMPSDMDVEERLKFLRGINQKLEQARNQLEKKPKVIPSDFWFTNAPSTSIPRYADGEQEKIRKISALEQEIIDIFQHGNDQNDDNNTGHADTSVKLKT
jgi:hypothetical protein